MPKTGTRDVISIRLEIDTDQMAAIRQAAGKRHLTYWAADAINLGCFAPAELPRVHKKPRHPIESLFLSLPPDLIARMRVAAAHVGQTRADFCRACFAAAITRATRG